MLLDHMHGIQCSTDLRPPIVPGGIAFFIVVGPNKLVCPSCESTDVWKKGDKERRFRSLSFGRKTTTIVLDIPRIFCHDCKKIRQVTISFGKRLKRCRANVIAVCSDMSPA